MSGTINVEELLAVARQRVWTSEQTRMLKEFKLINDADAIIVPRTDILKVQERVDPKAVVHLTTDGEFKFVNIGASSSGGPTPKEEGEEEKIKFSVEKIKSILEGKSLSLDEGKIKDILEKYVREIPKTADTYKTKEVIVKMFEGVDLTISGLLAAGTKILDAILYISYQDSPAHNFIFQVEKSKPEYLSAKQIAENIDLGNKAVKAAFCHVYNQGGLPSSNSESRLLSKFIRETIFKKKNMESGKLCESLSSADPSFFPASIFMKISLDNVPTEVSSRCKMSIAGNKAIRYAMAAQRFEKEQIEAPTTVAAEMMDYIKKSEKLTKALSISTLLSSLGSNFEAQKRMHPLSTERPSRKNFTLQLTCAVVYSLSEHGREALRKEIDEKKIEAFKRDTNIYGELNSLNEVYFPVLTNPDADFSELSVEAVKAAYGLTM